MVSLLSSPSFVGEHCFLLLGRIVRLKGKMLGPASSGPGWAWCSADGSLCVQKGLVLMPCAPRASSAYFLGPVSASLFSFCLIARFQVSLSSLYVLQFSASFLENSSNGEQHHHSVIKEQDYLSSFPSPFIHIINHLASQLVFVDLLLYMVVAQMVKNLPVIERG